MLNLHGWIRPYNIYSPFKFNIHVGVAFEQVRFDANELINKSIWTIIGIDSKKLDMFSLFSKNEMLKQDKCQITHLQGTNSTLNVNFFAWETLRFNVFFWAKKCSWSWLLTSCKSIWYLSLIYLFGFVSFFQFNDCFD